MRNCIFGVAILAGGVLAIYLLPRTTHPAPAPATVVEAEEQEARVLPRGPEFGERLLEPIVVERPDEAADRLVGGPEIASADVETAFLTRHEPVSRPDAGHVRRMPNADETELLPPVVEGPGAAEEAEVKEVPPSGPEPPLVEQGLFPPLDYHHHHPGCPYTGGRCPAPYMPPR